MSSIPPTSSNHNDNFIFEIVPKTACFCYFAGALSSLFISKLRIPLWGVAHGIVAGNIIVRADASLNKEKTYTERITYRIKQKIIKINDGYNKSGRLYLVTFVVIIALNVFSSLLSMIAGIALGGYYAIYIPMNESKDEAKTNLKKSSEARDYV